MGNESSNFWDNHVKTAAACGIAALAWIGAGISAVVQKQHVDKLIRNEFDISAVQIQQLNGSLTNHILLVVVLAAAATLPMLIAAVVLFAEHISQRPVTEPPSPPTGTPFPSDGTM